MSFEKGEGKKHLDKDFLEELKHKIWSTKGSRFSADNRLKTISKYSTLSNSFLSAYLIIIGLTSVYNLSNENVVDENILAFSLTAISILSLVFSLIENGNTYTLRAKEFHECALELSNIYNELQLYKTYKKEDATPLEIMEFTNELQQKYQKILEKYENHSPIDNALFRVKHTDYYKTISWWYKIKVNCEYFIVTKLLYILIIVLPVVFCWAIV